MKARDKKALRHKGHHKICFKTIIGEVEYSRAVYQVMDESYEKKFVYLLDEYVGFEKIGFISANLVEYIADNICETSYAQTAKKHIIFNRTMYKSSGCVECCSKAWLSD